ncbi:MAG: PUA domain-containing protein [Candidatus Bathyarchaeia archaeon]|nr:pseudouridine synthase [Candidatus Bathyarchaeota archaeon]
MKKNKNLNNDLIKLRSIANYQFGKNVGEKLFPKDSVIVKSKNTGKIRYIYYNNKLLATLRAKDGLLALTLDGAERILKVKNLYCKVKIKNEAAKHVAEGKNVFAKHIIEVDDALRPQDEVIVVDENDNLVAVGKAVLSGEEMKSFKHGVAIKVRRGKLD